MSKYQASYKRVFQRARRYDVHPVWRGIGCLLVILLPVFALSAARLLVQENMRRHWIEIPRYMWYGFTLPSLGQFYLVDMAVAILVLVLVFGLFTVVYSLLFSVFAPRSMSNMYGRK